MNDTPFENDSEFVVAVGSIGAKLKHAREKLDLSIIDIAKQLRLKPERIESLEKDDYQEMSNATFVKGYLRAYAHLVNISPEEILALFDQIKPIPEIRTIPLTSKPKPVSMQRKPMRLGVYIVGLALAVLVAMWWNSITSNDSIPVPNNGMPQPIKNEALAQNSVPQASAVIQTTPIPTTPQVAPQATLPTTPTTTAPPAIPPKENSQVAVAPMGITPTEKPITNQNTNSTTANEAENTHKTDAAPVSKKSRSRHYNTESDDSYSDNNYNRSDSNYGYSNNYDQADPYE